jgi:hypothetical protein
MWNELCVVTNLAVFLLSSSEYTLVNAENRDEKHFSLFSVVTFKNEQCTSENTIAGNEARAGTCYTSTECSDKKGTKSGNCASGFGVCCIFINTDAAGGGTTAATIKENRTLLRNSEYPTYATATTAQTITYTINKMQSDICQIRLDFKDFLVAGPWTFSENIPTATGNVCTRDSMQIYSTDVASALNSPTGYLCGSLTGEHLYTELSHTATDALTILITTAATGTTGDLITPVLAKRSWDIQVSQITCHASYRAPNGCQRYLMTDSGKITSFNYARTSGTTPSITDPKPGNTGIELPAQRINTCIRRSKGFCCVEYQLCTTYGGTAIADVLMETGATNDGADLALVSQAWAIDLNTSPWTEGDATGADDTVNSAYVDAACSGDYVEIPSSWSSTCGSGFGAHRNTITTRYCGTRFGFVPGGFTGNANLFHSSAVCDCSEPFMLRHVTDVANDIGGAATSEVAQPASTTAIWPRGFCIDFKQTPCWQ